MQRLSIVIILAVSLLILGVSEGSQDATRSSGGGASDDGPDLEQRRKVATLFREYATLHAKILNPSDSSAPKKFLVLQPLLGMGNSMIEEATALLISLYTRRALSIDLFDRSQGKGTAWYAPYSVYEREINTDKELLANFTSHGHAVDGLLERREHLYAQFNELMACKDWHTALNTTIIGTRGRFLGFPPVYGNKQGPGEYLRRNFGQYFFYFATHFLHTPSAAVQENIDKVVDEYVKKANCSVGFHIRWGVEKDSFHYINHNQPETSLATYMDCALKLCPLMEGTTWLLATDSEWVKREVYIMLPRGVRLWRSQKSVSPDNSKHSRALAEMHIIGAATHMVTTRLSTFSFASHARALKRPWVVGKEDSGCKRAKHSQEGLFVGQPVHAKWPWKMDQINKVSCADQFPRYEDDMHKLLSGFNAATGPGNKNSEL